MSKTMAAGARWSFIQLFAVSRWVETIGHALPIRVTHVPLVTVLPCGRTIKLERFARIEMSRILTEMLTQEFAPQRADHFRVPNRCIHLGLTQKRVRVQVADSIIAHSSSTGMILPWT